MRQTLHSLRRVLRWVATLALLALALLWCINNQSPLTISLMPFGYELQLPTYLLVVGSVLVGYVLALAAALPRIWRLRAQLRRAQQRLQNSEALQSQQQLHAQLKQELSRDDADGDVPPPFPNALQPDQ